MRSMRVVATWNLGNHLSICFWAQGNQEKPVSDLNCKTNIKLTL